MQTRTHAFEKQKQLRWLFQIHSLSKFALGETHGYSSTQLENCNEYCRFGNKFCIYFTIRSHDKLQDINTGL